MKSSTEKASGPSAKVPNFLPQTAEVIIVDEQVDFDGNIIPHTWLRRITTKNGRADVIACMVLAEIVYWYRGADVKVNGEVVGRKRKFDGDHLQKSYADLAEKLNLTKGQVSAAVLRLEKRNLIERDFRTLNIRGVKMSNVLFIRLFARQVAGIANLPAETAAETADESGPEGYGKKSGDLPEILEGEYSGASDTSAGPMADKYTEHIKDHTPDHIPGKETSTSAEPAEPAPPEFPSILRNQISAFSTEPGKVQSTNTKKTHFGSPVRTRDNLLAERPAVHDAKLIRPVLEQAFNGQKIYGRNDEVLQIYITEGRITEEWAEAFSRAKMVFDRSREYFTTRKIFIPFRPSFLIRNFDLTSQGVLSILGEQHAQLETANTTADDETIKPFLQVIAAYDAHFEKEGYFNREYREALLRAGCAGQFDQVLVRPERFIYHDEGDAVPPAWMRLMFAHKKGVCTTDLQNALVARSQHELRLDPGCVKLLPNPLSDEDVRVIFNLDYPAVVADWQRGYGQRDAQMEQLERLIDVVQQSLLPDPHP